MDGDGKISPKDIVDFHSRFCTETSYLISNDTTKLSENLLAKLDSEKAQEMVRFSADNILSEAKKKVSAKRPKHYIEREPVNSLGRTIDKEETKVLENRQSLNLKYSIKQTLNKNSVVDMFSEGLQATSFSEHNVYKNM